MQDNIKSLIRSSKHYAWRNFVNDDGPLYSRPFTIHGTRVRNRDRCNRLESPGQTGVIGSPGQTGVIGSPGQTGVIGSPGQTGVIGSPGQTGVIGSPGQTGPINTYNIQGVSKKGAKHIT